MSVNGKYELRPKVSASCVSVASQEKMVMQSALQKCSKRTDTKIVSDVGNASDKELKVRVW